MSNVVPFPKKPVRKVKTEKKRKKKTERHWFWFFLGALIGLS